MPKTKSTVAKTPLAVLAICILLPAASPAWGQSTAGPASDSETAAADVDLRPQFDKLELPTRAQGSRGTCSVFTVTRAIEFALGSQNRLESRLSVEFLNWASNRVLRKYRDGGFFSDLWKGFEEYGICDEEEMPYRQEFDPHRRPSEAAIEQAARRKTANLTLHWIKPWDPKRGLTADQFAAVKKTLAQGRPVCGGFLWPKQPQWKGNVLQMASRENVRDGHSVLLVGYRDDPSQPGGGVFLIQNTSKGPRDGALSYEFVLAYMNDAAWVGNDRE